MKIANVCVDVKGIQTDKLYNYLIEDKLNNYISIGSRVVIPFGKSGRLLQGFVLEIFNSTENINNLKSIKAVLENYPVLNKELIYLSKWLSKETYSSIISCLKSMLPNLLNLNTRRFINILSENLSKETLEKGLGIDQLNDLRVGNLTYDQQKKLNFWLDDNQISLEYEVDDKVTTKVDKYVYPLIDISEIDKIINNIPKNAVKQRLLLDILKYDNIQNKGILKKDLIGVYKIGLSTIKIAFNNNWIEQKEVLKYRDPFWNQEIKQDKPLKLNKDQQKVYEVISNNITKRKEQPILLEGITGSGKTEVYLQSITKALKYNKTAIMLVPEISLTAVMVARVRARFGTQVAVLHSRLSDGEKLDEWKRIRNQEVKVVVGARSAIFAPLENIGLIILDEEHSSSYKQDNIPRYHARDVAIYRAKHFKCPVILGSATPSLETRSRCEKQIYHLLKLNKRVNKNQLPEVKLIDMRIADKDDSHENFSDELLQAISNRFLRHEQTILMLNRRGFSSFVLCRECGFVLKCPNCDISLTMHLNGYKMRCHYCGYEDNVPKKCKNCFSNRIRFFGTGTEKIEQQLHDLIPSAKILRMDADTTRKKGTHEKILNEFGLKSVDILLGTQMISKGLDFPNVTLVGVLNADISLELPNFRASEKTFQLLTQVAGRAGRSNKKGEVIIQTFNPDHYAIGLAQKHDYNNFYKREMYLRKLGKYPPYYYSVEITASSLHPKKAFMELSKISDKLSKSLTNRSIILGPTPGIVSKIKQRYYYNLLIKYKQEPNLNQVLSTLLVKYQKSRDILISLDNNPQ